LEPSATFFACRQSDNCVRARARTSRTSSIFLWRMVGVSLTTSKLSRHTFSVQAAGAGSHKPRVGRGGRARSPRSHSVSTPSARSVSLHHDGVSALTSLRSRRTMMTRANSLHTREAGRPIDIAVTRGPAPTRASPHRHRAYDCRARPSAMVRSASSIVRDIAMIIGRSEVPSARRFPRLRIGNSVTKGCTRKGCVTAAGCTGDKSRGPPWCHRSLNSICTVTMTGTGRPFCVPETKCHLWKARIASRSSPESREWMTRTLYVESFRSVHKTK
jgi:hypothetical protein